MPGRSEATEGVGGLAPAHRPVRLGALRHRDFRLFWIGQLVSQIGTWMQSVAQAWLVLELTRSPLQLGIVSALQFTPVLFLSPIGGALSDRFAKRRVLLVSQTAMKLQALVLAVLVWSGYIQYWHVAVLATIYGLGRAIDIPARQAYVTDLVGRADLANAVALNSVVMNGARIVGPAVAGLLIAAFGVALAFLLNGVSFIGVLVALLAIRTEGRPDPAGRLGIREGVLGALAYAGGTPPVAFTLGLMVVVSLLVLNFNVVVPLVARDVLNQGAHGFGLLMSALGAGAVAGGFGVALLRRGQPPLSFLAGSAATLCAGLVALALVGQFAAAAVVLALLGCCQILFTTGCNITLQLIAPNELRGRVMGLYTVTFAGMTPFGSLLVGIIAEHQGVRVACAAGGLSALLGVAALVVIAHRAGIAWRHAGAM
ncbi:MAG: MFS transporter [Candidatus Rokuibacteriota bacterium]|nr:MAG: MFS transporter [Candidatus Rokubacteria bacterium]